MSIPAVKGFEIGAGFKAAELTGEENADEIKKIRLFLNPTILEALSVE